MEEIKKTVKGPSFLPSLLFTCLKIYQKFLTALAKFLRIEKRKFNKSFCLSWSLWKKLTQRYGNMSCWVFKWGVHIWKFFWLKINIPKGNYWILRIGVMGRCLEVQEFTMSKIIGIFLNFFSLKNFNLAAHFLLLTFFDNMYQFLNHFIF